MSKCHWTQRVDRWFDGQSSPETSPEISAHAAGCAVCSARLAELQRLRNAATAAVRREEIGDSQFPAFMAGVREGLQPPQRGWGRFWAVASLTAAALIAAVSTFIIISDQPQTVDATVVESVTTDIEGATVQTYEDAEGDTTIAVTMSKDDIW
jgi:anti-sigma factor RsiW